MEEFSVSSGGSTVRGFGGPFGRTPERTVKFWDSSAVVPLLTTESQTASCRGILKEDPEMVVWALTWTEALSALHRKVREGNFSRADLTAARDRLKGLEERWAEIVSVESVRRKTERLLALHPLRAADALQLAAALIAFEDFPENNGFVTLDQNLADAARREGFLVLPGAGSY